MSYILRYDYPGEDEPDVGCHDLNAVLRELADNVSGELEDVQGIMRELLEHGKWVDEGGSIRLFVQCGSSTMHSPFDKNRAHQLIYDLFINDDKLIRSMAAQSLKHMLGIVGPISTTWKIHE